MADFSTRWCRWYCVWGVTVLVRTAIGTASLFGAASVAAAIVLVAADASAQTIALSRSFDGTRSGDAQPTQRRGGEHLLELARAFDGGVHTEWVHLASHDRAAPRRAVRGDRRLATIYL